MVLPNYSFVLAYLSNQANAIKSLPVEIDEICFRARWVQGDDGIWGREWIRYIAAYERRSGRVYLKRLETRFSTGSGQGGGGALTSEELYNFIFRPEGGCLLKEGTIVHTDGARAYRDLDWRQQLEFPRSPPSDLVSDLLSQRPVAWRLETYREVLEREAAERRDWRGQSEEWSSKYRHLKLAHTSVCHSKKPGGIVRKEFVAVRRVHLHPDVR